MASELLGRAPCPECGFEHAHIKIKTDKEKAHPYRHCPECGAQYFPRNQTQAENLRKQIKAAKLDAPEPTKDIGPIPMDNETHNKQVLAQPENYKMVFGVRVKT